MKDIPVIAKHITIGKGEGSREIVGAAALQPTAIVMQIIVTDPTFVGGTLSSIINSKILIQPPSIPIIRNTAI